MEVRRSVRVSAVRSAFGTSDGLRVRARLLRRARETAERLPALMATHEMTGPSEARDLQLLSTRLSQAIESAQQLLAAWEAASKARFKIA
jgi:hypothetical protein